MLFVGSEVANNYSHIYIILISYLHNFDGEIDRSSMSWPYSFDLYLETPTNDQQSKRFHASMIGLHANIIVL